MFLCGSDCYPLLTGDRDCCFKFFAASHEAHSIFPTLRLTGSGAVKMCISVSPSVMEL